MSTAANPRTKLTAGQVRSIEGLQKEHGVDPSEVKILSSGEPWLGWMTRLRIALASKRFASIHTTFAGFVELPSTKVPRDAQVFYNTTVADSEGRSFTMPGVATIGERLWNGEEADAHDLAKSRSMASALDAAGWNPLGRIRPVPVDSEREETDATDEAVEAAQRVKDLRRIHLVARQIGLIKGRDERLYRAFLKEFYQAGSSAAMDSLQRHALINTILTRGPAFLRESSVVHRAPQAAAGVTPCCQKTPFELSYAAQMTNDPSLVTCGVYR